MKFPPVKTTLWGVFHVGHAWGIFRSLKAAFAEKSEAEEYAAKWSADNFESETMVEEIKVTIPAWDGVVRPQNEGANHD